jgi:hypothetical protein
MYSCWMLLLVHTRIGRGAMRDPSATLYQSLIYRVTCMPPFLLPLLLTASCFCFGAYDYLRYGGRVQYKYRGSVLDHLTSNPETA